MTKQDKEYIKTLEARAADYMLVYKKTGNKMELVSANWIKRTIEAVKSGEYSYEKAVADSRYMED